MKSIVDFIKKKLMTWKFKENLRNFGIFIVVYLGVSYGVVLPLLEISGGRSFNIAPQGIQTNWVLLLCLVIEIVFSILMIFSIKIDRKDRVAKVLFQYTIVFWPLVLISVEFMEGMHFFADAFAVQNGVRTSYPFKFIFMDSLPFAMDCRQIFHWIASFLPIVLLFAYDLVYLILFRKFENYDNNYDIAKREILRLNYELEYEKRNSAIYQ